MKEFARLVFLAVVATVFAVSCSKDEDTGSLSFDKPAVYLTAAGEQVTVHYSAVDIQTVSVSGQPEGWEEPKIDVAAQTVTIKAPAAFDVDGKNIAKSGTVTIMGIPTHGPVKSASMFIGVVEVKDLSSKPANSYVVNEPNTHYTFNGRVKGDGTTAISPAYIGVIWQSASGLLQYIQLTDGKVSFYIGANADDEKKIKEGNAIIGAFDANDRILWSWHVWASNYDPEKEVIAYANGAKVMSRNLGALNNANAKTEEILASFGLYYQWGRKDPFIGPNTYQASNGTDAAIYNGAGSRTYVEIVTSSAETGTMEYATQHPLRYITGVADSKNDWLWTAHDNSLWGASKTINDPCPYGWKVAPASAFQGLTIEGTPSAADETKYGWTLTDGAAKSLWIAAGRRTYLFGKIINTYIPVDVVRSAQEAQPWVGNYWSSDVAADSQSQSLYFWFEKKTTTGGIQASAPYARANGMTVRCVKVQ